MTATALPEIRRARGAERVRLVRELVRAKVLGLLGLPLDHELDPYLALVELGVDSLAATDLRNGLARELQIEIPDDVLVEAPTLDELAERLAQQVADG